MSQTHLIINKNNPGLTYRKDLNPISLPNTTIYRTEYKMHKTTTKLVYQIIYYLCEMLEVQECFMFLFLLSVAREIYVRYVPGEVFSRTSNKK